MSEKKYLKNDSEIIKEVAEEFVFSEKENLQDMCNNYDRIMDDWSEDELSIPEEAIKKLCTDKCKSQTDINGVIAKISIINQIYSTRVKNIDTYWLAKHITNNGEKLEKYIYSEDEKDRIKAVQIIANSKDSSEENIKKMNNHYSFATKYCSFHILDGCHNPDAFPIYDSYISAVVKANADNGICDKVTNITSFNSYGKFCKSLEQLRKCFGEARGEEVTVKEFDQFLWLYFKEKFDELKEKYKIQK